MMSIKSAETLLTNHLRASGSPVVIYDRREVEKLFDYHFSLPYVERLQEWNLCLTIRVTPDDVKDAKAVVSSLVDDEELTYGFGVLGAGPYWFDIGVFTKKPGAKKQEMTDEEFLEGIDPSKPFHT